MCRLSPAETLGFNEPSDLRKLFSAPPLNFVSETIPSRLELILNEPTLTPLISIERESASNKIPRFFSPVFSYKRDCEFKANYKVFLVSGEIGSPLLSIANITSYTEVICHLP